MPIEFELKKNLFGGYSVSYECPQCKLALRSKLDEAGKSDSCPDCGATFAVPGAQERARVDAERSAAVTKKQEDKAIAFRKKEEAHRRDLVRREDEGRRAVVASTQSTKIAKAEIVDDSPVTCPHCSSTQVTANQKGFGLKNAAIGGLLLGPVGLLGGMVGSKKVLITCLKCGAQFEPGR